MVHLNQFVPKPNNGTEVMTLATHGDCGAVDRMIDAKRARGADMSASDRLEGLEPIPQEFHHRALMLKVQFSVYIY